MAIYPCRICGNPMDPIYSDGICDDCYFGQSSFLPLKNDKKSRASSRSASSGKKKRKKIQKAAALIMAMMIALSSLCLSAFAEDTFTEVLTEGTYMGYDVIEFDKEEVLSGANLKALYDKYFGSITSNCNLFVYLMEFDDSGKPLFYSASSSVFLTINVGSTTSYRCCLSGQPTVIPLERIGTEYKYIHYKYTDKNTFAFLYCNSNSTTVYGNEYAISYTNGEKGFSGFVSDTRYLVFVPFNSTEENDATIFSNFVNGTKDEDLVVKSSVSYSAKFHSFASMNDNVGGLQGILNMIDWLGMGNQYPTCDFSINDNGNHHSYSLRISTNKNYVDICMSLWEDYRLNKIVQTGSTAIALAFTPDIISKFVLASTNGAIDVFGIRNNLDNITDAVRFAAQVKFLQSIEDLSYVTEYNLTNQHMRFNEGESSSRAYSVCLADYVSIVKGLVYKLEIIDNNTGIVLDKAYFCNDTSFSKTNTGYGTKVYNYDDYNDLLDDIDKGNDYGSSSGTIESDKLQTDNNNDIIVNFDPTQLDLGSYMDSLNGIVSNVSSFFTWVWALFPPEIMTIIIMGVGLLITCGLIKFFVG